MLSVAFVLSKLEIAVDLLPKLKLTAPLPIKPDNFDLRRGNLDMLPSHGLIHDHVSCLLFIIRFFQIFVMTTAIVGEL